MRHQQRPMFRFLAVIWNPLFLVLWLNAAQAHGQFPVPNLPGPVQTPEPPLAGQQQIDPPPNVPPPPLPYQIPMAPRPQAEILPFPGDPPAPCVTIKVRVVACSPAGEEIHYKICVENTSLGQAHHVLVRNPLPDNARFVRAEPKAELVGEELQWKLGTLEGCQCREITLVMAPVGEGDVKNCARVQYEHGQCVVTRIARRGPFPEMPPPRPVDGQLPPPGKVGTPKLDLSIEGPKQQYVNLPVTYRITLKNVGDGPALRPMIGNVLPDGTEYIASSAPGVYVQQQVAWLLDTLLPGQQRTVELTLKAKAPGEICNRPFALADDNVRAQAEICTLFRGVSALLLKVVDTKDPITVGGETSYTIEVENQGGVPATNIRIRAYPPKELAIVHSTGPAKSTLADDAALNQKVVVFEPVLSLAPGKIDRFEVFARALQPGEVRFKVELTADQLAVGGPVTEEEGTTIYGENERPMRKTATSLNDRKAH